MLKGKKIILGITGSIAAYKAAVLTRLLVKGGAEVKVIMTESAHDFITPLTLATLSKNPVLTHFTKNDKGEWNNHVALGLWADLILIAPASANTISKCVTGNCDNLLIATYLSAKCPVFFAPAMDLDMYKHPSTKNNFAALKSYGNYILASNAGELASGLEGQGRMQEPEEIVNQLQNYFAGQNALNDKKVVITAGPTYESIDPVRFIGNHSSGKMGYAIAEVFANHGAEVTLISGPSSLEVPANIENFITVKSAQEMFEKAKQFYISADMGIMSAAVADYRPKNVSPQKIKKQDSELSIEMEETIDIAAHLGKEKKKGQFLIGFALETENEETNAQNKLKKKNFDLIVLNSLRDENAAFGHDTNKVKIYNSKGLLEASELLSKKEIAEIIYKHSAELLNQ